MEYMIIALSMMQVALKLLPDTNTFISLLMAKGENFDTLRDEIQDLVSLLLPLLQDLHSTLVSVQSNCIENRSKIF